MYGPEVENRRAKHGTTKTQMQDKGEEKDIADECLTVYRKDAARIMSTPTFLRLIVVM